MLPTDITLMDVVDAKIPISIKVEKNTLQSSKVKNQRVASIVTQQRIVTLQIRILTQQKRIVTQQGRVSADQI